MSNCSDRRRQRGDMLMEALIGVLLLTSLGAGLAGVAGRVLGAQHEAKVADLAVAEMRRMLQQQGEALCAGPSPLTVTLGGASGIAAVPVEVACTNTATIVGVAAPGAGVITVQAPRAVALSVAPTALGLDEDGPAIVVGTQQ